jgi:hypothetical protein
MEAEEPWQFLATVFELANALQVYEFETIVMNTIFTINNTMTFIPTIIKLLVVVLLVFLLLFVLILLLFAEPRPGKLFVCTAGASRWILQRSAALCCTRKGSQIIFYLVSAFCRILWVELPSIFPHNLAPLIYIQLLP